MSPLEPWGLNHSEFETYAAVIRLRKTTVPELAQATGGSVAVVSDHIDRLGGLELVTVKGEYVTADHPATALGRLVAEHFHRIASASRDIGGMLGSVEDLTRQYEAGRTHRSGHLPVEVVHGYDDTFERITEIISSPANRVDACVPDQRVLTEFLAQNVDHWVRELERSRTPTRAIFQVDVLDVDTAAETMARLAGVGVDVRLIQELPSWFYLSGNDTVGLPLVWGRTLPENHFSYLLVRSPVIVAAMRTLFDHLWGCAAPLLHLKGETHPPRAALALAVQGMSDDAIARHLGVSIRTVRARIATAMSELGARSRLHAGYLAVRKGWLP